MIVFCVFHKLEYYYEDDDKTLELIFEDREKAEKYVKENPQHDLIIEEWKFMK